MSIFVVVHRKEIIFFTVEKLEVRMLQSGPVISKGTISF